MQTVDALYNSIIASDYAVESKLSINNVDYGESQLFSVETTSRIFSENNPTVGNAVAREIDIEMKNPVATIPRMATIIPYSRVTELNAIALSRPWDAEEEYVVGEYVSKSGQYYRCVTATSGEWVSQNWQRASSEWIQKGKFYIDTRSVETTTQILTIHGYDDMLKGEDYLSATGTVFPTTDTTYLSLIATQMGVQIDQRTLDIMTEEYQISYYAQYTMREMLGYIAAAYGGSFIMSDTGKLLLKRLNHTREDSVTVSQVGELEISPMFESYKEVDLCVDNNTYFYSYTTDATRAGDRKLVVSCPFGTQTMCDNLWYEIQGFTYRPYEATDARVHPAVELGDAVQMTSITGGIYQQNLEFGRRYSSKLKATKDEEIDYEYKIGDGTADSRVYQRLATIESELAIHAEEISAKVNAIDADESEEFGWSLTVDGWRLYNQSGDIMSVDAEGADISGHIKATDPNGHNYSEMDSSGFKLVYSEGTILSELTRILLSVYSDNPFIAMGEDASGETGSENIGLIKKFDDGLWIGNNYPRDNSGDFSPETGDRGIFIATDSGAGRVYVVQDTTMKELWSGGAAAVFG